MADTVNESKLAMANTKEESMDADELRLAQMGMSGTN